MPARLVCLVAVALCAELLAGCASRPVNAPITEVNRNSGYRFGTRQLHDRDGLYGDNLFDSYEQDFLKRDVQGELTSRFFSPRNWGALWSKGWGRSENDLPTSFVLSGEAVDRLRAASGTIIEQSPEFQRLLRDTGAVVVPPTVVALAATRPGP
jgi:hypothetical protein